jgi:sulfoxide reductase heme-binding subunit YedZ
MFRWKWWILKPALFLACLAPLMRLIYGLSTGEPANAVEYITDGTGIWTLRLLMITLAVTPIRRLTGWDSLVRFRRMIGLFTFFYGVLHFLTYIYLDQSLDFSGILKDIPKRPFITAGFTAWILMLPLAMTSTRRWIARLGGRRWQILHRTIYFSGMAAVLHYIWKVKLDATNPIRYAAVLAVLLGVRAWFVWKKNRVLHVDKFL